METESIEIIEPTPSQPTTPLRSGYKCPPNEKTFGGGEKPVEQKRKKGGQPGNHNAHTHGIYSKFILLKDKRIIEGMTDGSLEDELALARVRLKNALERSEAATTEADRIAWDGASHAWIELIVKIKATAAEKSMQVNEVWETLIEAVRATNDRQGVK